MTIKKYEIVIHRWIRHVALRVLVMLTAILGMYASLYVACVVPNTQSYNDAGTVEYDFAVKGCDSVRIPGDFSFYMPRAGWRNVLFLPIHNLRKIVWPLDKKKQAP